MTAGTVTTASQSASDLIPISVDALRAMVDLVNVDLYLTQPGSRVAILYRKRTHAVESTDLDRLAKRGISTLCMTSGDWEACCQAVFGGPDENLWIEPARRCRVLSDINQAAFSAVFHGGTPDDVIRFARDFGPRMLETIRHEGLAVRDLLARQDHDEAVYAHSVNVMTCSVLLAEGLGAAAGEELVSLAVAALLHDLGKRRVLPGPFKTRGPLNSRQRKELRDHPTRGFRELVARENLSWGQLMMVYQHHERVDGAGYPVGLVREEIHPWARICAVANVFCELTSRTAGHRAYTIDEALAALDQEAGTSLDGEMVQCWTTLVGVAPPSSTS